MKYLISIVMTFAALSASAVEIDNKEKYSKRVVCSLKGEIHKLAAHDRDIGNSPEVAYNMLLGFSRSSNKSGITKEVIKSIVNQIYFDAGFTHARGLSLQNRVVDHCMRDLDPRYKPLM